MMVTEEQDPFVGENGEEDDTLIMAPMLVEKLQVSLPSRLAAQDSLKPHESGIPFLGHEADMCMIL